MNRISSLNRGYAFKGLLAVMGRLINPVLECVSCKFSKLQYYSLAFVASSNRAIDEDSSPEIAKYSSPYYLPLNDFSASKGSTLYYILFNFIRFVMVVLCTLYHT